MNGTHLSRGSGSEAGFTLIELLITLTITVAIMTVVLTAVDLNANITRVQSDLTDLQQSTRVAQRDMQRLVRMIGRGGLPRPLALAVAQDSDPSVLVGGQEVVDHTDILTIRGAFTSPVFRIDGSDPNTFQKAGNDATLVIDSVTKSAFSQPFPALQALLPLDPAKPPAILLVGSQGDAVFAVAALTNLTIVPVSADIQNHTQTISRATLTLSIVDGASPHAGDYLQLSTTPGTFPGNLNTVAFASVVEEYQFFIREDFAIPGDATSLPSPKLARARMLPGTDTLHADGAIDIADNVFDFQVALGIDLDGNGRIDVENVSGGALPAQTDEWRWNHPADDDAAPWDNSQLQHVRLTIVGQAQTADRTYIAPAMGDLENHVYTELEVPTDPDQIAARRYRRRVLQSTVDLRNL